MQHDALNAKALAEFGASELSGLRADLKAQADAIKTKLDAVELAIDLRYGTKAKEQLLSDGKDTGTAHIADGQFDVVVTVPKSVSWDQVKLKAALDSMDPDEARHYAKVKVSVDERKFQAAPPAVQTVLIGARTVTPGKLKIEFKQAEAA